uniref:Triple gene block protein1 n=1 Tax=Plantago asiatica mosaic potexvirus TaxID=28354 RepID=B1B574_P1AMV|nr:triple gene block protein1 [Plantago asiatica mosaic virus]BAG12129.1 triple gene block protein2 [Plantago asiatica mosaic virus]BAG12134.1 triple gene block protein1 [Plantago asiatica mosaic virus]BAG12144.1 triple gene block protein1 [Plantago asiatica mosaic virus]
MDIVISALTSNDFQRTNIPISKPLVVHAVAGAGKTTLIQNLLPDHPNLSAQTAGTPQSPNLTGAYIRKLTCPESNKLNLLDEYAALQPLKGSWDVVLADPLQHSGLALRPHFVKSISHRLCPETTKLISKLICPCSSSRSDTSSIQFSGLFEGPLLGTIIALDSTTQALLQAHGAPFLCPTAALGLEFDTVTVVSATPLADVQDKVGLYISLSRHRAQLHVRSPPPHPTY